MNNKFQIPKIFETLVPFILLGIAIALFIGLLAKDFLFPDLKKTVTTKKKDHGRIIEHDEKK